MLSSGVAAGIFWMCMATLLSAITGAMVRHLGGQINAFELVFVRTIIALIILTPWMLRRGIHTLKTQRLRLYCLRVFFAYTAMVLLFYALGQMPIADVFALQYTIPLFTILLAVLILKQPADRHSWAACFVGFCGAMIVMRPGIIELTLAAVCALSTAVLSAGSNTSIKLLARTEGPEVITVYTNLLMMPLAFVPALFFWVTPSWEQVPWIIGVAVFGSVGGYCFTRSVSAADARVVQPFQFTRMLFATGLGFLMFGELPDLWTWVGAAVIFASSYYVVIREKAAKKAAAQAAAREQAA